MVRRYPQFLSFGRLLRQCATGGGFFCRRQDLSRKENGKDKENGYPLYHLCHPHRYHLPDSLARTLHVTFPAIGKKKISFHFT
jgi:hypothetical protein